MVKLLRVTFIPKLETCDTKLARMGNPKQYHSAINGKLHVIQQSLTVWICKKTFNLKNIACPDFRDWLVCLFKSLIKHYPVIFDICNFFKCYINIIILHFPIKIGFHLYSIKWIIAYFGWFNIFFKKNNKYTTFALYSFW